MEQSESQSTRSLAHSSDLMPSKKECTIFRPNPTSGTNNGRVMSLFGPDNGKRAMPKEPFENKTVYRKDLKRESMVQSLNERLKRFKIKKPKKRYIQTRNISLAQLNLTQIKTVKPRCMKSQLEIPVINNIKQCERILPPLPSSTKTVNNSSSFIQHRKDAYETVTRWDPIQQKNIMLTVWKRPSPNFLEIKPVRKKIRKKKIIKLTKKLNKLKKSKILAPLEPAQSPASPSSSKTVTQERSKNRKRQRPKSELDNRPSNILKNNLDILRGDSFTNNDKDITGASQKIRKIENICKIMLKLRDVEKNKCCKKFDQFGFEPYTKQSSDSDRKDDSLSSRIIRLRKKRKEGKDRALDSPLDMIQSKFNQIFRSLKN
ncbi:unnamed protein product [Moneuplotes crassus]|uniref:Uncharacterized protein n=1 Tax=Euplotes crassus TaxID=5936 RepID=A0AAD1U5B2_EUPCR|nr:unnamed protein product [Moneuplotes crassus]